MTTFQIRLIAIVTMVIDHIGLFFFPHLVILRVIGRISFPLFAWLIANGARHTRNSSLYIKRLLILACVSQVPFVWANSQIGLSYWYFNVVFTLSLGLAAILIIKDQKEVLDKIFTVLIISSVAYFFNTDYGIMGVASIVAFYFLSSSLWSLFIAQFVIFSIPIAWRAVVIFYQQGFVNMRLYDFRSLAGLLIALACIYLYNQREGFKAKYLFYIFYPFQYVLILLGLLIFY